MSRLLQRAEIEASFRRLGELARSEGIQLSFVVLGGTAMVLGFNARPSTKDVDFAAIGSTDLSHLRKFSS